MATKPLTGFRVLDLTNVLSGPFCCHQLAHMGAEVIKIEMPESGDLARKLGADPERSAQNMGVSFLAQNAGKRSVTLNLKSEAGKDILRRLVATSDVLVENFRPGVMTRLGLDYDALRGENPGLIYCAISGFGQTGPLADQPAYDQIIQGYSGVMSITGDADTAPYRVGFPIADTVGGLTAAMAVSAALAAPKERRGSFIDVSMLSSVLATMGWVVSNHLIADVAPEPRGNDNFTASPSGTFRTKNGQINIAANKQAQFETLCDLLGLDDLKDHADFADREARLKNRDALSRRLEDALVAKSTEYWVETLAGAGVPAGPVLTVPEILDHPHLSGAGIVQKHTLGEDVISMMGQGVRFDGEASVVKEPPPELGAHTRDILKSIGFDDVEIDALKRSGVI